MLTTEQPTSLPITRQTWNKGTLIGPKPPLQPKHVWAIRTRRQLAGRIWDLVLFNLAIDSKLRACDVVSLLVENVTPHGFAIDRASVWQRKTGRPVKFEVTEQTRQAVDTYIAVCRKKPGDYLFVGRGGLVAASPRGNRHACSRSGSTPLAWTPRCSACTRSAAPRRASSTGEPATCGRFSSSLATPRSIALSAISASRSLTPSRSRSRSISDPGGGAVELRPPSIGSP
jgi:hypothetical protein